jgi:penicillin-binding protein 1A
MRYIARILGFIFTTFAIVFVVGASVAGVVIWKFEQDLPDYSQLKNYEPPVMTRVHAADGSVLAEYSKQRRLYLPSSAIPPLVKDAFISAEDKNFYHHGGVDFEGMARAALVFIQGTRHIQGASTITQQVAKNFFLSPKRDFSRKIREALLSFRIEAAYSKEKILELYLNEIYLGMGNYGVAAAALNYFDKSVNELTVAEAAYLAALPKGPNNYNPYTERERAIDRRNWVIDRMVENGYVSPAEGVKAKAEPLDVKQRVLSPNTYAAGFFTEEVRRELLERYGEKKLYEGGLSVRTTLDPNVQVMARHALVDGLVRYDEARGFRGPIHHIEIGQDWGPPLAAIPALGDVIPWRLAVVLDGDDKALRIGLQPHKLPSGEIDAKRETGLLLPVGLKWARRHGRSALATGDVVYVEPIPNQPGQYRLRQIPQVEGAIVVMDPVTGRVLAMVGGFSFDESEFNRATQALRQPGSSFKPFVYAAAIDNGYTPSSIELDEPISIDQGPGLGIWTPENFEGKSSGPHTLRYAIEHSINQMTVRLARDIGMPLIADYARRFGVYDNLPLYLSMSLGSGETTLMKMTTGYSMLCNGGKRIKATLIDRIQDRWGHTIYRHDQRICENCNAAEWHNQDEPTIIDKREQVIDPMTAYQITSLMEGVVQRGTGAALRALGKPIAGKTGTTNDEKDVWFIGFSPDIVCGVYMGYDKPRHIANRATGGSLAAPVVRDFLKVALADKPPIPFSVPPGIKLVRVDAKTGMRAGPGDPRVILEAFKPGTAPPDNETVVGAATTNGVSNLQPGSPDAGNMVRSGTGGLY